MRVNVIALLACLAFPVAAMADGRVFFDEDWIIDAKGAHPQSFTLPVQANVHVTATCVKNCGKGYTVRVVPPSDFPSCTGLAQGPCRSRPDFDGFKVGSYDRTATLPSGTWAVYVQNSENMVERATVHVGVAAAW